MGGLFGGASRRFFLPTKVLFNTYPVAFQCPGGGEIQLLRSREALQAAGLDVLLYDLWRPQFNEVDLVHFFSVQGGSSQFCEHVKNLGLPLVISPIIWLTEDNLTEMPIGEIGHLLGLSDMILPNSEAEANQLSKFFNLSKDKFVTTHNGIDVSFAEPISGELFRERFGLERPFLLNVANIEPRKNQLSLIRAAAGLDMDLVVLGNVRFQSYFDQCLREGAEFVKYLGYVDHEDDLLKSAYSACEAFVLPSVLETPSLAALEAAASGARIAITSEGSTKEYFQDLATYVDPKDVADIRQGIITALERPRDDRLRKHTLDNFTWSHTAEQLIRAYGRVLANRPAR